MEKSVLEKRIEGKAEERFENEFKKLNQLINSNDVLKKLNLKVKGVAEPIALEKDLYYYSCQEHIVERLFNYSNIEEVKKELIGQYIKEETDNMLARLENLNYLFNQ